MRLSSFISLLMMKALGYITDITGRLGFDFLRYEPSRYDQIYEIGKTAIEKFGKDPSTFRETLDKFTPRNFRERIKENAKLSPSSYLRFDFYIVGEYVNCLIAILQVDLEYPGFIKNFPEALTYLEDVNGYNSRRVAYEFEEIFNKTIKPFNRYSGKSDYVYVKTLFEIPDEEKRRYDKPEIRFDDFISTGFSEFWKSGNDEHKK